MTVFPHRMWEGSKGFFSLELKERNWIKICNFYKISYNIWLQNLSRRARECNRIMNKQEIVVNHFDSLSASYDEKSANRRNYLHAIDQRIITILSPLQSPRILDAGTGTGTRAEQLKRELPNSEFYACDISPQMVSVAKTKELDDVQMANMADLQYPSDFFYATLCLFNSFGYIPSGSERRRTLYNFHRVLKEGGYLFIDVLNRWHIGEGLNFKKSPLRIAYELASSVVDPRLETGDVLFKLRDDSGLLGFFHSFTDRDMRRYLSESGFSIDQMEILGYDTGQPRSRFYEGQLFYVCRK